MMKKQILLTTIILLCSFVACGDDADESGWYIRMTVDGVKQTFTGGITDYSTGSAVPAMINSNAASCVIGFHDLTITSGTLKSTGLSNYIQLSFTNRSPGTYSNGTVFFYTLDGVEYHAINKPVVTLTEVGEVGGVVAGSYTVTLSNAETHQIFHVTDGRFRAMRATTAESAQF